MLAIDPPAPVFAASAVVTRAAKADTGAPALAVNPQGQVLVAWRDARDRVIVRAGASGRTRVAGRTEWGGSATAALRADGFAAVLYLHQPLRGGRRTLEVATARPGRAFSRPRKLVSVVASVGAYQVFAAGDRFVAVWSLAKAVRYAVSDTAGRFGPARTLARVDGEAQVSAAADASGTVLVAFRTPVLDGGETTYATLAPTADRFGAPRVLAGTENSTPRAYGGPGGAAVGFQHDDAVSLVLAGAESRPIATVRSGPDDPEDLTSFYAPVLALRGPGATVAAWAIGRFPYGDAEFPTTGNLQAAQEQPDGSFSNPTRLSARYVESVGAVATSTTAVITWREKRRYRYSLNLAPALTLTASGDELNVAAAGEHVVAAWTSGRTIRLARVG
ncbi:hypothetical protein OJ998_26470 [Solirubrobacter taibaiensis]|nr:hypothetical protein [Solirubrobacter taibaiensis]